MITQKYARIVPLTRELATRHYSLPSMPGEREFNKLRDAHFNQLLESGQWGYPVWSIAVIRSTGQEYRADGQHTSCALTQTSEELFPTGKTVTYQAFEIDSLEEDAAKLFMFFDNSKSARQNVDYVGVYLAQHQDIHSLSRRFAVCTTRAIDYHLRDHNRCETDHSKRHSVFEAQFHGLYFENLIYRDFALWLRRWEKTKNAWLISKAAPTAEILSEWLESPRDATTFWNYAFTNSHPDVEHETRKLGDHLDALRRKPHTRAEQYSIAAKKHWDRFRRAQGGTGKKQTAKPSPKPPRQPRQSESLPFQPFAATTH